MIAIVLLKLLKLSRVIILLLLASTTESSSAIIYRDGIEISNIRQSKIYASISNNCVYFLILNCLDYKKIIVIFAVLSEVLILRD